MAHREGTGFVGWRKGTSVAVLAALLLLVGAPMAAPRAAAGIVDSHVLRFEATPPYINLNRTTSIAVEIGSMYGAADVYRVTVTAPDGSTASAVYNFASIGSASQTYGDASSGFMTTARFVGTYALRLDYFDGVNYVLAAMADLRATNQLTISFSLRSGSDPFTGLHSCPTTTEYVRGAKLVGGAYVYFASTGEAVNATNSDATGNITGAIFGVTKVLIGPPLWHNAWKFGYNVPTGQAKFYVNASDGRGNFGSAVTGSGVNPRLMVVADTLAVSSRITDTAGVDKVTFVPGDTLRVEVQARYDDKGAHELTADPNPADPYNGNLTPARGGQVKVHIGWGAFNVTRAMFANELTNLTLAYETGTKMWTGTYVIPTTTGNLSTVQALITASDNAPAPANTGTVFSTQFAIRSPAVIQVPVTVEKSTGFEMPLVAGLSILLLVVGLGIGLAASRGRRAKSGTAPSAKAPAKEESEVDEWEDEK